MRPKTHSATLSSESSSKFTDPAADRSEPVAVSFSGNTRPVSVFWIPQPQVVIARIAVRHEHHLAPTLLERGPHSRSSHPARVTDSLDSSRNERIHRRHLRHRYVTRVARPHRGRVASSPRRALGALCLPDRICSLSSGFYSFSVGASRARFARYLGQPRPSPRRRWIRCSRHDVESDRVRIRGERRVPCSSALS